MLFEGEAEYESRPPFCGALTVPGAVVFNGPAHVVDAFEV